MGQQQLVGLLEKRLELPTRQHTARSAGVLDLSRLQFKKAHLCDELPQNARREWQRSGRGPDIPGQPGLNSVSSAVGSNLHSYSSPNREFWADGLESIAGHLYQGFR